MTAIAGIIRHDQCMADKEVLERMCNVLAPYGKDAHKLSERVCVNYSFDAMPLILQRTMESLLGVDSQEDS